MVLDVEGPTDPEQVPDAKSATKSATSNSGRPVREHQAPSWQRTFKRALIFAPIMFATVFILPRDLPLATKLTQTLLIVAIFVPFSYFLDRVFYRSFQRRQANSSNANSRGS